MSKISELTAQTFPKHFVDFCRNVVELPIYPVDLDGSSIVWSTEKPTESPMWPLISLPGATDQLSPARKLFFQDAGKDASGTGSAIPKLNAMLEWRFAQLQGLASRARAYYESLEDSSRTVSTFIDRWYEEWESTDSHDELTAGCMLLCFSKAWNDDLDIAVSILQGVAKELWDREDFAGAAMIYELLMLQEDRCSKAHNMDLEAWEGWVNCLESENQAHPACIFQGASIAMLGSSMSNFVEPFLHAAIVSGQSKHPAQDALRAALSRPLAEDDLHESKSGWINVAYWMSRTVQLAHADEALRPHLELLVAYKERADQIAIQMISDKRDRIPYKINSTQSLNDELHSYARPLWERAKGLLS